MKAKHQRLILVLLAIAALIAAAFIAANALRNEAAYFYTPTTLKQAHIAQDKAIRLGGMVKRGSIQHLPDGVTITFTVQDRAAEQHVRYTGIAPDLFVEGSGVVADGHLGSNGLFIADSLLAKHDEKYVPRELKDMDMRAEERTQDSVIR